VKPFCSDNAGAWSFSAWQYIPADFESGASDLFSGSHFILYNTYDVGGPYHWSVQIQVDSADKNLKVFEGNGFSRIDVPYESDRWTEIQVIVDKDDDWTRIYYDDELITEYSWTGGVIGEGGGALDIAGVELWANDTTKLYYDDLRLEPITGCGGELLDEDFDLDGSSRLQEFLDGTDPCNPDTDQDTVPDAEDNCPTEPNPDQLDIDFDGIGDVCDDVNCPGDTDGNNAVDIDDIVRIVLDFGHVGPDAPNGGDVNGDMVVNIDDIVQAILNFGPCF
jgi:hypothetical protein